jgi:putative nucleotidyltransferase with HDIG domain
MEQRLSRRVSKTRHPSPDAEVLSEVVELVNNPTTSIARLAATLGKDKTLTSTILRKANSLYYGFPGRVTSVNFALVLLGFNALHETLTQTLVSTAFRNFVGVLFSYEDLWNHSFAVGLLTRAIAEKTGRFDAEEALIAGLLHDVGFLLIEQQSSTAEESQNAQRGQNAATFSQMQVQHGEIGSTLAQQWKLPEAVVEAIRYHHQPERATCNPALTAAVHLADVVATRLSWKLSEDTQAAILHKESLEQLGLDESVLSEQALAELFAHVARELRTAPQFEEVVKRFRSVLIEGIEQMEPTTKVVLALHYAEGISLTEIGRFLRRSDEEVQTLHDNAIALLRNAIGESLR